MQTHNSNHDPAELDRFNQLADEWWDLNGSMKPLHLLNPVRLAFVEQHTALDGKNVLDVGCGGGILSEAMAKQGANVSALDLSEDLLAAAKQHAEQQGLSIDYRVESAEAFSQQHLGQFDVVTCMEMLEHVPDPSSIIKACFDVLPSGGVAVFSTINRNLKSFAQAIVGAEYILRLLPRGTHEYAKLIKPSELCRMAREAGFEQLELRGIKYNPFTSKASLTDDTSINYLVAFKKP